MTINGHHRRRLESWKEIAAYLGRGERTLQRWERDRGLPVHRTSGGGRGRVYAWSDELERWLRSECQFSRDSAITDEPFGAMVVRGSHPESRRVAKQTCLVIPPEGKPSRSRRSRRWWWLVLLAALGVTVAYLVRSTTSDRDQVDHVVVRSDTLQACAVNDNVIWARTFDLPLESNEVLGSKHLRAQFTWNARFLEFRDLDGDGQREILCVTNPHYPELTGSSTLYCLDTLGREKWQYRFGEPLYFGRTRYGPDWMIQFFIVDDLDADGQLEIVALSHHGLEYPAKVSVLEPDGTLRGDYINSGNLQNVIVSDLNGDGRKELLCAGINNGYRRGACFILDIDHLGGASPQPDTPDYQLPGRPLDRQWCYLLFPLDPLSAVATGYGIMSDIELSDQGIMVAETPAGSRIVGYGRKPAVLFVLDNELNLSRVSFNQDYRFLFEDFTRRGWLRKSFPADPVRDLGPILYWDGQAYTPEPAGRLFR